MSENNLLEEYKLLYNNSKRDSDKFLQMMLTLQDVVSNLKDVAKNLQDDNQSLRTQLSIIHHQNSRERTEFPNQISTFIDIIEEEEIEEIENRREQRREQREQQRQIPTYSIPPHIRQVYLENLGNNNTCSICLEDIELNNTIELTECGHIFHNACIRRHRNNNNNCPVCRTQF